MGNNDESISRRKFLEQAGATVGAAALGAACASDDESGPEQPNTTAGSEAAGQPGPAGSTGAGTGASPMPSAGSGGRPGGAAGSTPAGGTGGSKPGASGSGGAGTGAAPAAGTGGSTAPVAGTGAVPAAGSGGTPPPSGKIIVGIVKKPNVDEAVARAVELAGGLDEIKPGQTVFIKPNAVNDRALGMPGIRTSNEVLAAVVKLVKMRMPGKIIVGDRSARTFPDTEGILTRSGMREAVMAAGADEVYGAKSPAEAPDEWMLLQPPMWEVSWRAAGGLYAMKKILEADHLINVPTCKNHQNALYSLSMKAFMGGIGDSSRNSVHISNDFNAIGKDLAIMNQMFHPLMNIIDATTALINGGPQGDRPDAVRTSPGIVFASKDRVAVDAAAVSLIQLELDTAMVPMPDPANATLKRNPAWKMPQIVNGIDRKIGNATGPDTVQLMFDGVDKAAMIEAKFRA
ncbi:MAG TPA: DUF362 domain-containing protein [Polyangiales bacterium]|nr:DUF362 domain-containing protein [Polyangiales bacterium]